MRADLQCCFQEGGGAREEGEWRGRGDSDGSARLKLLYPT